MDISLETIQLDFQINLFNGGGAIWRHHFLPFKVTLLGRGIVGNQCRDIDKDKMHLQLISLKKRGGGAVDVEQEALGSR